MSTTSMRLSSSIFLLPSMSTSEWRASRRREGDHDRVAAVGLGRHIDHVVDKARSVDRLDVALDLQASTAARTQPDGGEDGASSTWSSTWTEATVPWATAGAEASKPSWA